MLEIQNLTCLRTKKVARHWSVLLHLFNHSCIAPDDIIMSFEATQDGIAAAIGIDRAHVSLVLKRLIRENYVDYTHAHTNGMNVRRRAYYILPRGLEVIPKIREGLKLNGISEDSIFFGKSLSYELKKDPWKVMALQDIEAATAALNEGKRLAAIDHLLTAVKKLASSEIK